MEAERLLADEDAGWDRFRAVLDRIDPDRMEDPTVTPEGWSPKDVLAHVAVWLESCGDVLEAIALGAWDPATYDGSAEALDRFNAEHAAAARSLAPGEVHARLARARERARGAFEALDAIDAEAWSWFEESGPMHYAKHAHDLLAFAEGTHPDPEVGPLLQRETDAWLALAGAIDAVPPELLERPGPDGSSTRDAMHHLASWLEHATPAIARGRYWYEGGPPAPAEVVDAMNERFRRAAVDVSPVRARLALEGARTHLREVFSSLTGPGELAKRAFRIATIEHYDQHRGQIEAMLPGPDGPPT